MTRQVDVLVIGGGISGLSLLFWLEQHGLRAELWERKPRLGGKIKTRNEDGYLTEAGASMLVNFRPEVSQLLAAAGLDSMRKMRREQAQRHRYLLYQGELKAVSSSITGQLVSGIWKTSTKLRLLLEWFIPPGGGSDETVSDFVRRRLGPEILERAVEPFVAGHLASDPEQANARAVLPGLTALERQFGSITMGLLANKLMHPTAAPFREFFSFHNGMQTLVTGLANACRAPLKCSSEVVEISPCKTGWRLRASGDGDGYSCRARHVAMCIPAHRAADLLTGTDRELSGLLKRIRYAPMSVVHTGFDKHSVGIDLDGAGFLAPRTEQRVITGNLWHSALFAGVCPSGKVLLSSYLGGARASWAADLDDADSVSRVLNDLRHLLRLHGSPEMVRVDRHRRALPLYHGHYHALTEAIKARARCIGRLSLVANYMDGISVRDRIVQSHAAAADIQRALAEETQTRPVQAPLMTRPGRPMPRECA